MRTAEKTRMPLWPKITAGLAGAVIFFVLSLAFFALNIDVIYQGVRIEGVDVAGKSQQDVVDILEAAMKPVLQRGKLTIVYGDKTWEVGLEKVGGTYNYYEAAAQAYSIGRKGNPIERIRELLRVRKYGADIRLEPSFDRLALRALLEKIDREIAAPPVNASIARIGGEFVVTPEEQGIGVDIDGALAQIGKELKAMDLSRKEIPLVVKAPDITRDMLEAISSRWSLFSTVFDVKAAGRSENLRIASAALEGVLIKPGGVFSFNEVTGLRIEENGYQEAPVIFEGELVPGIGGGVCQVSSTLYNAALYANLEIVERHSHSIPSAYISMGQDATVVDNILDLKLRNNTGGYIYIASWVKGDRIYAAIYGGEREEDIKVKIRSEIVQVIDTTIEVVVDPSLPPGVEVVERKGREGYKIKTYRQVIRDGRPEDEELLSFDYYKPEKGLVRKGPDAQAGGDMLPEA